VKYFSVLLLSLSLFACTQEAPKVGFDTLEQARAQARENGAQNAQTFRAQNPQYSQNELYMRGDSTIKEDCPQGDGWASIDVRTKTGEVVQKIKCSTVSLSLGCLEDSDFKTKSYANEDGRCNPSIPHPIPKLTK
jgi:hypothetical protein